MGSEMCIRDRPIEDGSIEEVSEEDAPQEDVLDEEIQDTPEDVATETKSQDSEAPQKSEDIAEPSSSPVTVPTKDEATRSGVSCLLVTRNSFGAINEIPFSEVGLQNNLETAPTFIMPLPAGLELKAIKCLRDSLTPDENDYKVARAGYPFFYIVRTATEKRAAALEFSEGKYRMNLLDGFFTDQELVDAKARILSFNESLSDAEEIEGSSE